MLSLVKIMGIEPTEAIFYSHMLLTTEGIELGKDGCLKIQFIKICIIYKYDAVWSTKLPKLVVENQT